MYINIEGYKNIEEELKLSLIIPMCPSSQSQDIRNLSFWECSNEKLTSFIFIFLKAEYIIQQTPKHVYRIQFWVFNIFSNEFYFQTGKNRNVEEKKYFGHKFVWPLLKNIKHFPLKTLWFYSHNYWLYQQKYFFWNKKRHNKYRFNSYDVCKYVGF